MIEQKSIKRFIMYIIFAGFLGIGCSEIIAPADTLAPNQPKNFVLLGGGDGQAYFRWESNNEPDFKEFRLFRSVNNPNTFELLARLTQTEYVDRFLSYDSTYYYYLIAIDNAGNVSERTNIIDVQPLNISAPQPPSRVIASGFNNFQTSSKEIQLSWIPPNIGDLKNYFVYRSQDSIFTSNPSSFVDSTELAIYIDRTIEINKKYYYQIIAVDKGYKTSLPSKTASDLILENPVLISPANNSKFGNPQIFTWQSVQNSVGYKIFVGEGPFSNIIWTSNFINTTEISYNGPAFQSSKIYYWWVGAYSRDKIIFDVNSQIPAQINSYSQIFNFFVD